MSEMKKRYPEASLLLIFIDRLMTEHLQKKIFCLNWQQEKTDIIRLRI